MGDRPRSVLRYVVGALLGPTTALLAFSLAAKFGNAWWLVFVTLTGIWAFVGALGWRMILAAVAGLTLISIAVCFYPSDDPANAAFTLLVGAFVADACILVGGTLGVLVTRPYLSRRQA